MPSYFKINSGGFGPPSYYGYDTISITDYIRDEFNRLINEGNYRINYDPNLSGFGILNKKETNKMEAKKCDRCGKLYEKKFDKTDIQCVFKHEEPFFTGEEKNYSKEYIEDKKTHEVYIKRGNGDYIDMCPDCRKAFKTWFESADKEGKKNG